MSATKSRMGWFGLDAFLAVAGTAGIAVLFLPFDSTLSISPLGAIRMAFTKPGGWLLGFFAAPFFLSILITGAALRQLISSTLSRAEQSLAYVAAAAMACLTILLYVLPWVIDPSSDSLDLSSASAKDLLISLAPAAVLLVGAGLVVRNSRPGRRRPGNAVMALEVAYLANFLLCLLSFSDELGIGAYLALITAVVYVVDIARFSISVGRHPLPL